MNNKRQIIYLAGLLHDIHSFWKKGDFFDYFESLFPTSLQIKGEDGLATIAKNYKSQNTILKSIVNTADIWASGFDKYRLNENESHLQLTKIFDSLLINGEQSKNEIKIPMLPLSLDSKLLGLENNNSNTIEELNDAFELEFNGLPKTKFEDFSFSLFYLLKKYTWCIPAYKKSSDISLFEHLKLTASIAQSLFDYYLFSPSAFDEKFNLISGQRPLSLWCIDISGIQKFIYNISSKYASKSLKGRSFYLQAVLDRLADYFIQETQTTHSHIVYSSGGKFFMNLPNTIHINNTMENIKAELQEYLLKDNFYVCFGNVAWSGDSVELSELWSDTTKNTSEQKSQKFKSQLISKANFKQFFEGEMDEGGQKNICVVSGIEIDEPVTINAKEDKINISKNVVDQILLGDKLQKLSYCDKTIFTIISQIFNVNVNQTENDRIARIVFPENENIKFISNKATGFQFYGGSEMAMHDKKVKNFEELVGIYRENRNDENSTITSKEGKYNKLGVLRMDIDDLGRLFTEGFEKDNASFSAFATLSNALDWFFSGYINTIRRQEKYKDWVNIIYSGGDDIFIVGRWNKVIDIASEIKSEFQKFVGRKEITISAGLTIVNSKFPIAKVADMSGEALEKSKNFKRENGLKNAITLFNISIGWEEYNMVFDWKEKLVVFLKARFVSTGLLQKVFGYYEVYAGNLKKSKEENEDLSWKWNLTYNLARQAKKTNNENKRKALNEIKSVIFTEIDQEKKFRFEAFIVACRWAELEVRDIN